MKLRRSNFSYDFCQYSTQFLMHCTHKIVYDGLENIPEKGPALVLAKHQSYLDIIAEGMLLRTCKRRGSWLMKSGLPGVLEYLGGIKIQRLKDVNGNREKMRVQVHDAKQFNADSAEYIMWLYSQQEIVVVHPEGTRIPGKVGAIKKNMIEAAKEAESMYNLKIPLIPVGIEYLPSFPFSTVHISAGNPVDASAQGVEEIIKSEIGKLSYIKAR